MHSPEEAAIYQVPDRQGEEWQKFRAEIAALGEAVDRGEVSKAYAYDRQTILFEEISPQKL